METYLANELNSADIQAQYDTHAKRLLSDRKVLSYILKYSVREFSGYSLEEAQEAIVGETEVEERSVRPFAIKGGKTESDLPGERKLTFDVVFQARTNEDELNRIYLNVEAQKDYYPGYDLTPRGVIYASRLISEQLDTEFTPPYYDKVKKTYSIWICMNSPKENESGEKVADSIVEYRLRPEVLYPDMGTEFPEQKVAFGRYDLLSVIQIRLCTDPAQTTQNKLIGFLSTLFSDNLSLKEKKTRLIDEYGFSMSDFAQEEVSSMCNLSEAILEKGEERGRQEGELAMLYKLVQNGDLSINAAMRQARDHGIVTEADFRKSALKAGYRI